MAGSLKNAANAYKEGALEACILYCQEAMQSDPKVCAFFIPFFCFHRNS